MFHSSELVNGLGQNENFERLVMVCVELSTANVGGLESLSANALSPPMHACGAVCVRWFRVRVSVLIREGVCIHLRHRCQQHK